MTQIPLSDQELLAQAKRVLATEAAAVAGASEQIEALPAIARLLASCEGHILVTGVGTSAAVARRLAHLLSCCSAPALPLEASDGLHGGSGAITARDVLLVISKGGKSAEINRLVEIAKG
ncbi:MAG: SIS domain-containing protein, partial [Chloroflexi bacterium]|nr:SIS domain-containing protein [Chloroflexota bacterium]